MEILHDCSYYFASFCFFSSNTLFNPSFFACAFENLMENFLPSYFRYSHLTWSSRIFSFSRRLKQKDMCSFNFSENSLLKVKELFKIHKPLSLVVICNLLRVKDIGEGSVERDTSISVFIIDSCNLLETKKQSSLCCMYPEIWF